MSCPLHGEVVVSRAERRRMEREVEKTNPARGNNEGYRITVGYARRRYSVREPNSVSLGVLIAEADAVAKRLGCTCEIE